MIIHMFQAFDAFLVFILYEIAHPVVGVNSVTNYLTRLTGDCARKCKGFYIIVMKVSDDIPADTKCAQSHALKKTKSVLDELDARKSLTRPS